MLADAIKEWLKKKELAIFNSIKEAEELGYEPYKSGPQRTIMDEHEIQSAIEEISRQIARDYNDLDRLLILGIRTKGSLLAQRIAAEFERQQTRKPEVGEIEIYGSGDELRRIVTGRSRSRSDASEGSHDHFGRRCHLHRQNRQKRAEYYFQVGEAAIGASGCIDRPGPPRGAGETELRRQEYSKFGKRASAREIARGGARRKGQSGDLLHHQSDGGNRGKVLMAQKKAHPCACRWPVLRRRFRRCRR